MFSPDLSRENTKGHTLIIHHYWGQLALQITYRCLCWFLSVHAWIYGHSFESVSHWTYNGFI